MMRTQPLVLLVDDEDVFLEIASATSLVETDGECGRFQKSCHKRFETK